jgi:homoserine O-succinyltransferase
MPIVAHNKHPSYQALQARGHEILSLNRALSQDIRELHVGLLNMMPDAALSITDQQFIRLIGACNKIVQFYIHPFSIPGLPRNADAQAYINEFYEDFDQVREEGLDALIITGANVTNPSLETEIFWDPLKEVIDWAKENVTSILCSCLATHALMNHLYQIDRHPLPEKKWGVYHQQVTDRSHPLLQDINTRFDVPHSRWNEVQREDLIAAGIKILVESENAGVHLAVSPDQFRIVYFQGHPEYDRLSLLKEYKREVLRFLNDEIDSPPPYPEYFFSAEVIRLVEEYLNQALRSKRRGERPPEFQERVIEQYLDNTWGDTAKAIFNNWLGLVYKLTHVDRHIQFMDGIDPQDPLGLLGTTNISSY